MMLSKELDQVAVDLEQYYETDFDSEEEELNANRLLKMRIKDIIISAHELPDSEIEKKAFTLLVENTGCAEDYEIFIEIADQLTRKSIYTEEDLKTRLGDSPVSRWF